MQALSLSSLSSPSASSCRYEVTLGEGITGGLVFLLAGAASAAFLPSVTRSRTRQVLLRLLVLLLLQVLILLLLFLLLLQVLLLLLLLVSGVMSCTLVILSGLRLLSIQHDLYYLHYGLVGL